MTTSGPCSLQLRACFNPSGTNGSALNLTPVAAKIAFPIAGAMPTIGASPEPAEGRSFRSSNTISIFGMSLNRGTRYCEKRGFEMRPSSNRHRFKQRTAESLHDRPFDLVLEMFRIHDRSTLETTAPPGERLRVPCFHRFRFEQRLPRNRLSPGRPPGRPRYPSTFTPSLQLQPKAFAACLEYSARSFVSQILQPKFQRILLRADASSSMAVSRAK